MQIRGRTSVASTIAAVGLAFAAVGCGDDGDSASTTESSGTGPTASLTSAAVTETDLVVTDCDDDLASGVVLEAIKGSFLLQVGRARWNRVDQLHHGRRRRRRDGRHR